MKAVLLRRLGPLEDQTLALEDVADPVALEDQVVIAVSACGVCRSNLHMIEGDWADRGVPAKLPIIPGHEVVGRVVELGARVSHLAVGQRVGVQPLWSACGRCRQCLSGHEQRCAEKLITGESVDGGYAEYLAARADYVFPLPESLTDAAAAPLFCPGVTAYGAVKKAALVPGQEVAIFGVGGVGHLAIELAVAAGARVTAVARSADHLELATELGAEEVLDPAVTDVERWFADRGGADAAIVFAPSDAVGRQAMHALRPGGIGVFGVPVDVGTLEFAEKRIVNTTIGSREDMLEVLALAAHGTLRTVTEQFALAEARQALMALKAGRLRARAVLVTTG